MSWRYSGVMMGVCFVDDDYDDDDHGLVYCVTD